MEKESVHGWAISMIWQDKVATAWFVHWGTQGIWFSFNWGGETPFKKVALWFRNAWSPLHKVDYMNFWLDYYEVEFIIGAELEVSAPEKPTKYLLILLKCSFKREKIVRYQLNG